MVTYILVTKTRNQPYMFCFLTYFANGDGKLTENKGEVGRRKKRKTGILSALFPLRFLEGNISEPKITLLSLREYVKV